MASLPLPIRSAAEAWLREDPSPEHLSLVRKWLESSDETALLEAFGSSLAFGTAGLRGIVGPGPNRMNHVVIARASAGLAAVIRSLGQTACERGIVIGFDGRNQSRAFAEETAQVIVGAGVTAHCFADVVPTPLLAFAVRHLGAAAGVMVTASHNPPEYNGYKVYWGNGAQIIPPQDRQIADAISSVASYADIPRGSREASAPSWRVVSEDVEAAYLNAITGIVASHGDGPDLTIAYTALHGVGERLARAALARAGFSRVVSVAEQAEPNGAFPTVAFPNPEEPGAMDLVLALAEREGAELVLANDPDADRLAVAARGSDGAMVRFNGNEVGALLGYHLLSTGNANTNRLVLESVVSSPLLEAIAIDHGCRCEQTLTGFKWIANRAIQASQEHHCTFVFGYEEALGYSVGDAVRDKDGVGTALVVADMARYHKRRGETLVDALEAIWRRYGLYLSSQLSIVLPGQTGVVRMQAIMERVRATPPGSLGTETVERTVDFARPEGRSALPATDMVAFYTRSGCYRVMLRPSGTEPKLKCYFDIREPVPDDEPVATARKRGEATLARLRAAVQSIVDQTP